jgi:hypothetical protein
MKKNHCLQNIIKIQFRLYSRQKELYFSVVDPDLIRTDLALLDPDPYGECGSEYGFRSKEIDQNLTNKSNFKPFKKAFVHTQVCFMAYYIKKSIFHEKLKLFVTAKFLTRNRNGILIGLVPRIRIRIEDKSWIRIRN